MKRSHRRYISQKELSKRLIEESPKLKALKEILVEISAHDDKNTKAISVLITASDDRTCLQIKQVKLCESYLEPILFILTTLKLGYASESF